MWLGFIKSSFAPAFFILNSQQRKALVTLYRVCRVLDDAVDERKSGDPRIILQSWRRFFTYRDPSFLKSLGMEKLGGEFLQKAEQVGIPWDAMIDLIDKGLMRDLLVKPFKTALELEEYAYGVAGTVGLACLPIFGVPVEEGRNFAVKLGVFVQWVNMIRDVGEDARKGRVYLPLEHLKQFGYTEMDILALRETSEFKSLMAFEAETARSYFYQAMNALPCHYEAQLEPAVLMGRLYHRLLNKLERKHFPVLRKGVGSKLFWKIQNLAGCILNRGGINNLDIGERGRKK